MTAEIVFLLVLLSGMILLFLTERIPVDLTAFMGLVLLTVSGVIRPEEAFTGFASPAVITMLAVFIVSAALLHTGVADAIGGWAYAIVGGREIPLIVVLMLVSALLSAFMNNIAATAVLMPAVAGLCRRAGLPPSRLFMPLAFGAILGGTTTLVGTPPNILASTMLAERGLEPFSLFEFTPIGCAMTLVGVIFMITVGRRLLPSGPRGGAAGAEAGGPGGTAGGAADLARVYRLQEQLFSIRIPPGSHLHGRSLAESKFGTTLGVQVVSILREGRRRLAPRPDLPLAAGDVLLVEGRVADLKELLHVRGVEVEQVRPGDLPRLTRGVGGVRAGLAEGSPIAGRTLKQVGFRERFGIVVVGIVRDGTILMERLGSETLRPEDQILALGARAHLEALSSRPEFVVHEIGFSAVQPLQENLFMIRIPEGSPLDGLTVRASRMGELVGLTVAGLIRDEQTRLAILPDEVLKAGDGLVIVGRPWRILGLLQMGNVEVDAESAEAALETEEVGVVEAALAPRSALVGKTLEELSFRSRYGLQVLAVWREGTPLHTGLAGLVLRFGDALLLQGPWERVRLLASDAEFVVLSHEARAPRRTRRAPVAVAGLLLMIGLVVAGLQPIHVAAFTAATLVILGGALRMEEAYRAIEWRAIFLVAAVLPVGIAVDRSGAAALLAGSVTTFAGPLGPTAVLAALIVLSSLLSQGLDGAPAVVLLTPVVIEVAAGMGVSPRTLMMGVSLAASAAFMTPFSHKANLLVMGAGGYRALDYARVGTPLTVVLLVLMVVLVPVLFPF